MDRQKSWLFLRLVQGDKGMKARHRFNLGRESLRKFLRRFYEDVWAPQVESGYEVIYIVNTSLESGNEFATKLDDLMMEFDWHQYGHYYEILALNSLPRYGESTATNVA